MSKRCDVTTVSGKQCRMSATYLWIVDGVVRPIYGTHIAAMHRAKPAQSFHQLTKHEEVFPYARKWDTSRGPRRVHKVKTR